MKYEIKEHWGQTFVVGKYACALSVNRVGDTTHVVFVEGMGSTCEIARSNAYCELANKLLALIP